MEAPVGHTPSTAQTVWVTVTAEHCPPEPPVAVTKTVCVTCGVVSAAGTTTVVVIWPLDVDTVWFPPTVTVTTLCVGRIVSTVSDPEGCSGLTSEVADASPLTGTTTVLVSRPVDVEAVWPPPSMVMVTTLTVGITVCTVDEADEAEPPPFPLEPEPPPTASALVTGTTEEYVVGTPLMVVWIVVGTEMTVTLVDVEPDESPPPLPGTPPLLGGSSVVTWTVEEDSEVDPLTVTVTTVGTLTTVLLLDSEPEPPPDGVGMKTDSLPLAGERPRSAFASPQSMCG